MADETKLAMPIIFFGDDPRLAGNRPTNDERVKDFRPRITPANAPEPPKVNQEQVVDEVPKDSSATKPASDSMSGSQNSPSAPPAETAPAEKVQSTPTVPPLVIGN